MTAPVVSVVVPTRNRAILLGGLVTALEHQRLADPFEVVIVDDGSTDGTWSELQRLQAGSSLTIVLQHLERQGGPARARNVGWRAAAAPLVAFTDDDCVPQAEWLSRLVAGLASVDLVQGCTVPNPDHAAATGPFSRTVRTTKEWGYYETSNMGYRKTALIRVGGFDEGFRYPFGEDTDLAWRVKDSGGVSRFDPDAVVHHAVWPGGFVDRLRDLPRREGMVRVLRRNPDVRRRITRRWFWERSHPPAMLAAVGLGLLAFRRRSPKARALGLAALAPYIRHRTRVEPLGRPRQWPIVVPQALVIDLAEVAVLAAASARYRTLLL
ncbi:MAG: glycosyl transferase family 2 [Acidimicrobiales bacterium]|nr:glycosyl transferase family 2 [Acidimicrobiales bacterium]